jgi:mediator of RNA polymerase II transcription subunit 17
VQVPPKTEVQKHADSMVAIGWKLQSLDSAADALLKSATRLEREMERETNYWEKILAVKEQGWSVCRLPREKHTLGVKYGFSEGAFASQIREPWEAHDFQLMPTFAIAG